MSRIDVARTFFTRMDARDTNGALALVASHAGVNLVPLNLQGDAEKVARRYFEQLISAFPDLSVRVRRLFVANDGTAVAEVTIEGTQTADFFGIINQEKFMDLDQVWLLHVTDGAIDRIKAYWCQNQLYRRLGVKRLDHVTITT
ncbi:MAG TPA: ester cyclase [Ktedonobacteraceae bacterium]